MKDIEFILLKTETGAPCGHARVQNGVAEIFPRGTEGRFPETAILTKSGVTRGSEPRIRVNGELQAIAMLENGTVRCCGLASDSRLSAADVRLRVTAKAQTAGAIPLAKEADALPPYHPDTAVLQAIKRLNAERPAPEPPTVRKPKPAPEPLPASEPAPVPEPLPASEPAPAPEPEPVPEPAPAPEPPIAPEPAPKEHAADGETDTSDARDDAAASARDDAAASARDDAAASARDDTAALYERVSAMYDTLAERVTTPDEPLAESLAAMAQVENPFPHIFPNARFSRERGAASETLHGVWQRGQERMLVTAVRGEYSPQPPSHLAGYTRYIRSKSGGYWVKVE